MAFLTRGLIHAGSGMRWSSHQLSAPFQQRALNLVICGHSFLSLFHTGKATRCVPVAAVWGRTCLSCVCVCVCVCVCTRAVRAFGHAVLDAFIVNQPPSTAFFL